MRTGSLSCALLAALLMTLGTGCGGKDTPVSVNGVVTLDGKPVEGATITFIPQTGSGGRQATGSADASGAFKLTTLSPNDGAIPGEYKVIVQYNEGAEAPPAGNMKDAFSGLDKSRKEKPKQPPKFVIPPQYSDAVKTALTQKVPAGGTVKLELQSK